MALKDNERAFITEISKYGVWSPFERNTLVLTNQSVSITLEPYANGISFDILNWGERRKGVGSKVLDQIVALARKHKVKLTGAVEPFGAEKNIRLSKTELRDWYKRHGFKYSRYGQIELEN